jgi:predicted ester cyclase
VVVEVLVVDGDRVAVRYRGIGTHTGSFAGEAPTGRTVMVHGTTIYGVQDGVIVEDWESLDEQPFRDLLGGM